MAIYSIDSNGLSRLGGSALALVVGSAYYLGASDSPRRVLVTRIEGERVFYRAFPYQGDEVVIETSIARDLVERGTRTVLAREMNAGPFGSAKRREECERVLAGQPGPETDPADYVRHVVVVEPVGDFSMERAADPWYAAEAYGSVCGMTGGRLEIRGYAYEVRKLADDGRFRIVSDECPDEK